MNRIRKIIGVPFLFLGGIFVYIGTLIYGKDSLRDISEAMNYSKEEIEKMEKELHKDCHHG